MIQMVWSGAYQSNKKEVGTLSTLRIPEGSKCLTHASDKAKALNHHRNERLVRAEFESYFEEGDVPNADGSLKQSGRKEFMITDQEKDENVGKAHMYLSQSPSLAV